MELNDNEFDAAFREKVFDAEPQYEEAAWNKMEQKLKRRDHVFFRKATALCLSILLAFGGYFIRIKQESEKSKPSIAKQIKRKSLAPTAVETQRAQVTTDSTPTTGIGNGFLENSGNTSKQGVIISGANDDFKNPVVPDAGLPVVLMDSSRLKTLATNVVEQTDVILSQDSALVASRGSDVEPASVAAIVKKQKRKRTNRWPVSLSLSLGPEFNSSASLIGGKKGFSTGIGFSIGLAKRFRLQTGMKYSTKAYGTDGYGYAFKNESIKPMISRVEASCEVLEIPLQASFTVMEDNHRSIDLNAGMSSYFMLKEDYTFKYTETSGYKDRFQEFNNENQHYFGVIDLSATYYIKLKKEKFMLGVEPYVKLPVAGVGAGNVNLKSSGVALKLRYDLGKKNK
jgi:hypothetical protein